MKCSVCNKEGNAKRKIKHGKICESCYSKLPYCIRDYVNKFTSSQIEEMIAIFYSPTIKMKYIMGKGKAFGLGDEFILFSGKCIKVANIRDIKIVYHPRVKQSGSSSSGIIMGYIGIKIETRSPHLLLEDLITSEMISFSYTIGPDKAYKFYHQSLESLINVVRSSVLHNMQRICWAYNGNKKTEKNSNSNNTKKESNSLNTELLLFGLHIPFTQCELKNRRNQLLKKAHPDNGGSIAECQRINIAYDRLKRFAT